MSEDLKRQIHDLKIQIKNMEAELAICDAAAAKMASILTRSVNAIRGEPGPLHLHSWHDLPELIDGLKVDLLEALIDKERDSTT
jgi:hypothetical protein